MKRICPLIRLTIVVATCTVLAQPDILTAQPTDTPAIPPLPAPTPVALTPEVFDALAAIQNTPGPNFGSDDLHRLFHAIWWDLAYTPAEENLTRKLRTTERPVTLSCSDGRSLDFDKLPDAEAANQQRFLLVTHYNWKDSTYFVEAFRNTKDAGLYIGACRVHENAAEVMESLLVTMVNEARFAGKNTGGQPLLQLFNALETAHREANPGIQAEFADAVRRVLTKFDRVPPEIRDAAWLKQ